MSPNNSLQVIDNKDVIESYPPLVTILGPTCCWKSEIALKLALELDAEIISCDSMQIYEGLAIGTAQPDAAMRRAVPHHLISCLPISEPYDVNRFIHLFQNILNDIRSRGRRAILVGGTGLYAKALIYGFSLLPSDPALFAELNRRCLQPNGPATLLAEFTAQLPHGESVPQDIQHNPRRLLRAYEVLLLTGSPPWRLHVQSTTPNPDFQQFCIVPQLALLKERIRLRCRKMLEAGWVEEALEAGKNGLMGTPTARQALGYRDILSWVENHPHGDRRELEELLSNRTIQYARRQLTWFRHQHPGAVLLAPETPSPVPWLLESIRNAIS